jgi:hypothetical protein
MLTEGYVRDVLDGSGWQVSEPRGSMGATRLARRGDAAVAVKVVDTPLAVLNRLSELGVTPPVLAAGEHEGRGYIVQQAVSGPSPDHEWFASNVQPWAAMVGSYLGDEQLHRLVEAIPAFWRLTVPDAVAMIDSQPTPRTVALREPSYSRYIARWRRQSEGIVELPMRPIHPDPHWHNYVIADGQPYLLDWDYIDLSDPLRDVGVQVWGFLPRRLWAAFLRAVGLELSDELELAIHWWAAFKLALNAHWNDRNDDEQGAAFHARLFGVAVDRRPWVDP